MRGRPRTPIGTYGKIKCTKVGTVWVACARFRTADGRLPRRKRTGPTKQLAENRLKEALRDEADRIRAGEISPSTKFSVLAAAWIEEFELAVERDTRSHNSLKLYRGVLDNHVLPALGELAACEVTVARVNKMRNAMLKAGRSWSAIRNVQVVISGICGYAVVHEAMDSNPVRDLPTLENGAPKKPRALTAEERADLFAKLDKDPVAVRHSIPDLLRAMLSTGVRIGEVLASTGDDVQRVDRVTTVRMSHRIIRVKGQGLRRVARRRRSTKGAEQLLEVPSRSEPMWTRRKLAAGPDGPLFPDSKGGWQDPGNATHRIKAAMVRAGYGWVTSHVMRKTVATVLAEAGLSTRDVANQLGQATEAITERHYIEKPKSNAAQAKVLDGVAEIVAL